jgi:transcriptional regulator with XRE-family HTH domain
MASANNIQTLREARNWSRPQLGERMGTSGQQIERLEKGMRKLTTEWIDRAAAALEVPATAIISDGSAAPLPPANATAFKFEGASHERMRDDLPIYGTALGAERQVDGEAVEQTTLNRAEIVHYAKRPVLLNGNAAAYGLYVSGYSMEPRYKDGAKLVVDPKARISGGDDVVVYLRPESPEDDTGEAARAALIKTLVRRTAAYLELEQYTPAMRFRVPTTDVVTVHRVLTMDDLL